jgi:hypothetical protein
MCRKAHGAAVRSRASVKTSDFRWTQGAELVTFYESSPGNHRGFCRVCGSPLLSRFDFEPSFYGIPLGALDDDPGIKPKRHIFVAYKAPWYDITDELPQFPQQVRRGMAWVFVSVATGSVERPALAGRSCQLSLKPPGCDALTAAPLAELGARFLLRQTFEESVLE